MIRDVCILCIHIRKLSESQENNTSCSFEVCTIHIIPCGTKLTLGVIIKIYIYIYECTYRKDRRNNIIHEY